jgi:alpha-1,3-rhamnosyl/mannosyltransferase
LKVVLDGRCIQDHFPGIARYSYNLARALATVADEPVDVLVDPTAVNRHYDLAELARAPGLRLRPIVAPVFSPAGILRTSLAVRWSRAEMYHSPYYLRPPIVPSRSVVTVFDLISETFPPARTGLAPRLRRRAHHAAVSLAIRCSSHTLVPSQYTLRELRRLYPGPAGGVSIIPLGVEKRFAPAPASATAALRDRYGLPARFILAVAINKPHKNLARLVEALRSVPEVALVLAGPVDRRYPDGAALAARSGLADRVIQLGPVPDADLPVLYSAATAFAFTSLAEGFGLPPLEAMACGTAVVCSRASSLPEVAGDAALLVDPGDASAIAAALNRVLEDAILRERLVEAGRERAAELTWERTAWLTWAAYQTAAR